MKFRFIDLFAGIGGMRLAFEKLGGECVFSSEWDKYAQKTYFANFKDTPKGDIRLIKEIDIPKHDILLAGFPCQAFSIAGRKAGFEDTRGTLFFDVARILRYHEPKAFFLENVKGLRMHNKGKTLETILNVLRKDLNYYVPNPEIINAKDFGVPQKRERIFIVGFRKDIATSGFQYPKPRVLKRCIRDIIEKETVSAKYYLSTRYLDTLRKHKERHSSKGNGFGYEIKSFDDIANAIVVGGMGRERNLIIDKRLNNFTPVTKIKGEINREYIRRMTPREWARLQGFPDDFQIVVSDTQAYKQFGNSVAVPAIKATGEKLIELIENNSKRGETMSLSGNKGEWSEIYTLLKLLSEGKLYAADEKLHKVDGLFYEILRIIREEKIGMLEFNFSEDDKKIQVVKQENNDLLVTLKASEFQDEAKYLLSEIQQSTQRTFSVVRTEDFMSRIFCQKLKASSTKKTDIEMDIYDPKVSYSPRLGFSIKSRLGNPSTLLNASKTTNFVFKIIGNLDDEKIKTFNKTKKFRKDLYSMVDDGFQFQFHKVHKDVFNNNLLLMDSDLPHIISHMLLLYYTRNITKVRDILDVIKAQNPMNYDMSNNHPFYECKFKRLLAASALGMLPKSVWDGQSNATGGYIIVREDGEVLCYHLYNRNEFEEYLLNSTCFDTPSRSRHDFGKIYCENNEYYIKLNIQLRFIHNPW